MDRRRFLATAGTLPWAVPLLRPGLSEAATGYPNRAITYVAPYPAGTTTDEPRGMAPRCPSKHSVPPPFSLMR